MDYLHWAKVHNRVRYELTISGVPQATWADLGPEPPIELEVHGSYGHPRLIELIAKRYNVPPVCVVPVPGASSANFIAFAAAADRGARVVLEHPIYQPMQRVAEFLKFDIRWLRRRPEHNFAIDLNELESYLRADARAVILTNLHNPSGQYIPPEEMKRIADLCAQFGANLVVDEVYLDSVHLNQGERLWTAAQFGPHVIGLNSLTKVYGLAGLRMGWIIAGHQPQTQSRGSSTSGTHNIGATSQPGWDGLSKLAHGSSPLADRAREIMDLLSANNAAPATSLAIRGFERIDILEDRFRRIYRESQPIFREWLKSQPMLHAYPNHGALFDCIRLPLGVSGDKLNELLVSEYDTQIVSGSFFDLPNHIRLTPAAMSSSDLSRGLSNVATVIERLSM